MDFPYDKDLALRTLVKDFGDRVDKKIEELRKLNAVEVRQYRDRFTPKGFIDYFRFLLDRERLVEFTAAQTVLEEHFPRISNPLNYILED